MQFKKNRAILAAVVAAAMAASAMMTTVASAAGVGGEWTARKKAEKYGDETYAERFLSLYDDVITNGEQNGYLSSTNKASGGFGVPYHSIEELICEAPDYGHETTSEAMSYIVWIAAMNDNITKKEAGKIDGVSATSDLAKAWKTLEMMIPDSSQQKGFFSAELSAQTAKEWPEGPENYPSEGNQSNVGKNPIAKDFSSNYSSQGGEYLLHWLADVDDWYGFSGSARGTAGKFTFINTFQRGDQESCFETIPHPAIETLEYGNSTQGMKFAFQESTAKSWSYTNAPDAEDRAIQAVAAANRWGVGDSSVSSKAGMMGDFCRNDMFDKYYKTIGCQSYEADASGGGLDGQHFLMSWYTAWGGAADGTWAWQIGCSHSHQFYQNPLAAYDLLYDTALNAGMKSSNATKDYTTSLQRQMELYLWLQAPEGPFAGGCTNSWNGKYEKYPSGVPLFYDMAYIEHPVYADPGSNGWTGNQFWATQRLAELYYVIKTDGDKSSVKPGGLSLEKALETVLDKWVDFFVSTTTFTDDDYSVVSNIKWSGQPDDWSKTYKEGSNKGLKASVGGEGNSDFGCAASLADTLIYYAKAKGVEPKGTVAEKGSTLEENALYTAQTLLDRIWSIGRDDYGVSRTDHNGSLARVFAQEVYIPAGKSGTYPYGYTVQNGAKFIDIRPMYEDLEGYQALKDAYDADVAAGAKMIDDTGNGYGKNNSVDCKEFTNVASVDLTYHRFWHVSDVLMGLGTMYELYPQLKPTDTEPGDEPSLEGDWGNVDCSTEATLEQKVNVADAVLLARLMAEDKDAVVSAQGKLNAQCAWDKSKSEADQILDSDDLTYLLEYLAGIKKYSELGNQ